MKLKEIAVFGLYNDYDCTIALNEEGITFLHSLNGTGKTTIIRLVNAAFNNDEKTLMDIPFKKIVLTFNNGSTISVVKRNRIECVVSTKEHDDTVGLKDIKGYIDVLYISPERMMMKLDNGYYAPAIDSYLSEFSKIYSDAKKNDKLQEPKKLISIDDDRFVMYCQNLKARMDYIGEVGIKVTLPSDIKFPPNRYDYSENREKYVRVVSSITEWVDRNYNIAESIIIYLDVLNKLFNNKDMSIDSKDNMSIRVNGKVTVPISALSAGEKHIMIMFFRLLFHAKPGSFVFMDEPENSLHVTWQQNMGSLFQDICRVRDIQMLIATHSPQIIHDKWDLATELRSDRA